MENIIHDFSWFASGAFLALVLRRLLNFYEGTQLVFEVLSRFTTIIETLSEQVVVALALKHDALKKSDLTEKEIEDLLSEDLNFIKDWRIMCVEILLSSLPKKYYIYLKHRYDSTEGLSEELRKHREEKED